MQGRRAKKRVVSLVKREPKISRKQARKVTTKFHKYTRERDTALERGDEKAAEKCNEYIEEIGGIVQYQRASQVSTAFHSTSKWVLGVLRRGKWFTKDNRSSSTDDNNNTATKQEEQQSSSSLDRIAIDILEVGAINTELLDAASRSKCKSNGDFYRLNVRAIDIHSMDEKIEEADFLTLPVPKRDIRQRYHVLVCSMVINCVTDPEKRGEMLSRLYHFLRPGGLCFLTLPKTCLHLSPYMTRKRFLDMLSFGGVGFEIVETKESPKIAFFVCRRPTNNDDDNSDSRISAFKNIWTETKVINQGKKFRTPFSIILNKDSVTGQNLEYL